MVGNSRNTHSATQSLSQVLDAMAIVSSDGPLPSSQWTDVNHPHVGRTLCAISSETEILCLFNLRLNVGYIQDEMAYTIIELA